MLDHLAKFDTGVLKGKSVVITGGASGFGEAFARAFISAGAFVTIGDVNEEGGKKVADELGSNAQFVRCDITSWQNQLAMFKAAIAHSPHKSCDIVCANAGIGGNDGVAILDDTDDPKEPDLSCIKVHTIGTLYTTKLARHYFSKQPDTPERDRCLIITASLGGYVGMPGTPQYCMAKWGVRSLMRTFSETNSQDNIRTNLISPTYVQTPLLGSDVSQHLSSKGVEFATVSDVTQAALHLACDSTVNGRSIGVLSRNVAEKGYFDLQDEPHTDLLKVTQEMTRTIYLWA